MQVKNLLFLAALEQLCLQLYSKLYLYFFVQVFKDLGADDVGLYIIYLCGMHAKDPRTHLAGKHTSTPRACQGPRPLSKTALIGTGIC